MIDWSLIKSPILNAKVEYHMWKLKYSVSSP